MIKVKLSKYLCICNKFWSSVPDSSILLPLDWLLVWKVVNALCNKLSFETIFSAGRCVPNPQEFCSFINFKIISLEQRIPTQWATSRKNKKFLPKVSFFWDPGQDSGHEFNWFHAKKLLEPIIGLFLAGNHLNSCLDYELRKNWL